MQDPQKILRIYLEEQFQAEGMQPDEQVMKHLLKGIRLEEGNTDESQEERSVSVKEDHHGTTSAEMFHWYRLIKLDFHDLFGLGMDATAIMMMSAQPVFQIAFATLKVIHTYLPKLKYEFQHEDDAKILGAIALLNKGEKKEQFTLQEVQASLAKHFATSVEDAYLQKAIDFFRKLAILRYVGNDRYQIEQKIDYERE